MSHTVSFSIAGNVGVITVNNPPVNALSRVVAEAIMTSMREAEQDSAVDIVVLTSMGRTFIAGADVNEIRELAISRQKHEGLLQPLMAALEDCRKPMVCAINGAALGGGLEVAMACHYRVALASSRVGLPEVKLGLIPGGGGTQRLPRLAGVAKAAEMCSQGDSIGAVQALKLGILDHILNKELLPGTLAFARKLVENRETPRRTRDLTTKLGDDTANAETFAAAREQARKRSRGRMAPLKAIDAVEAATRLSFEEGCKLELEIFNECLRSDQSGSLIHVFFAEREVSKILHPGERTPVTEIRKAAIVGGGTMGAGIAMAYVNAGIPVILREVSQELLDRSLSGIQSRYRNSVAKGRLTQEQMTRCMGLIQPALTYDSFSDVDVVVEAVLEDLQLKMKVFRELDSVCPPETILATNTSSLDIDQIASVTSRPQKVIGHHFFVPASTMNLIEIVRGRATAIDVIASSLSLAKRLGKKGVVVGNCPGFVGNRMYYKYQREAQFLVEEGARVWEVDAALYDFGMAMGPFATRDLSGLDVAWRIQKSHNDFQFQNLRRPLVLDRLYEMGRFGQKTGAGWYRYRPGQQKPDPDPEVEEIVRDCAEKAGIERRHVTRQEIVDRTICALVNEGAKILEEGVASRAMAIDVIFIDGYGFPAHRGGPMWFADQVGLKTIYDRIRGFEQQCGAWWSPAPLLRELAEKGGSFAEYDRVVGGSAAPKP